MSGIHAYLPHGALHHPVPGACGYVCAGVMPALLNNLQSSNLLVKEAAVNTLATLIDSSPEHAALVCTENLLSVVVSLLLVQVRAGLALDLWVWLHFKSNGAPYFGQGGQDAIRLLCELKARFQCVRDEVELAACR